MSYNFVHLHSHSEYSKLDGMSRVEDMVDKALEYEQKALAITDHGHMGSVPELYMIAKQKGIKPIIGQEFYLVDDVTKRERGEKRNHLVMLALNREGYKTLCKLSSLAAQNMFYYPRIDHNILRTYSKEFGNIVATSSCMSGEIPSAILAGDRKLTLKQLEFYNSVFPNFFLEFMKHGKKSKDLEEQQFHVDEERINGNLMKLHKQYNIPLIVTNDSHYIHRKDNHDHEVWLCMQTSGKMSDGNRFRFNGSGYHFCSSEQMEAKFPKKVWKKSEESMAWIVENTNIDLYEFTDKKHFIPSYGKKDPDEELKQLCLKGLKERIPKKKRKAYKKELLRQLKVIKECGYADEFLIVNDYVQWARRQGIAVGSGRGSMVGVLVSYLCGITDIDPIRFDLSFERALNPERPSLPDFDIDFSEKDKVLDYLRDKYGEENTMQIGTYNRLQPRSLLRNVLRVFEYPYQQSIQLTKQLPDMAEIIGDKASGELDDIVEQSPPELAELFQNDRRILPLMNKFSGLILSMGTHAGGMLIGDGSKPIRELIPTIKVKEEQELISQFDKSAIEKQLGFVKFDILGLTTLRIIQECVRLIGKDPFVKFPDGDKMDDKKTFDLINSGNLTYVFQLDGMANRMFIDTVKGLHEFEDIVISTSIARPGSAQFIPELARNRKRGKINYLHKDLEPILGNSEGILIYQEQVMAIAQRIAGFNMIEVDDIKDMIKGKDRKKFDAIKPKFIQGSIKNGYKEKVAEKMWALIEKASGYLFNRSHAVSYSVTTYQTAWLKAHYPLEFFTACLNTEGIPEDKLKKLIEEAYSLGVKIKRPDIHKSMEYCTVEGNSIRLGLTMVKWVGYRIANNIVLARQRDGKKGILGLPKRVMSKRVVANLRDVGAFGKKYLDPQRQYELLGFILDSPIQKYEKAISENSYETDNMIAFGGVVDEVKKKKTRRGSDMAYIDIARTGGVKSLVLFQDQLSRWEEVLQKGTVVIVEARKQEGYDTFIPVEVEVLN